MEIYWFKYVTNIFNIVTHNWLWIIYLNVCYLQQLLLVIYANKLFSER